MTEKTQPESEEATKNDVTEQPTAAPKADPVKRLTQMTLVIAGVFFIWYMFADRFTPWTDQAKVQAYVIPIVPQVSGRVLDVNVTNDQFVEAGTELFEIDPSDYILAVENAQTSLELAGQELGAGTASVATAQAGLVQAETNLEHVNAQSARVFELEERNLYSKSEGDKARAAIKAARAQVDSAQANLEKARQSLGAEGENNPRIRSAMATLKKAQLDLSRTKVIAPALGGVTNLQIEKGYYAKAGAAAMTFVEAESVWVQANLKENNLAHLQPGAEVDLLLDIMPGTLYKGVVRSVGFAVSTDNQGTVGSLQTVKSSTGWLRDPQRFPVIIEFAEPVPAGLKRVGGQVDVQVYNEESPILNVIGKVWITVLSWLSFIY
ncbi:HlyD family secretion protein [Vibrio ulleungensis]|uniref:HlyD family secretion protein n=1 Tax=Vibrio ulleungensis TaxID=2807619 RepID=A0ABS2HGW7_9VIBR|nr:HlyD family secretion protein [Vibrio ulleungensis]MBM7036785.1 HlyD family secretion protein [Vibrio ulleungensis]